MKKLVFSLLFIVIYLNFNHELFAIEFGNYYNPSYDGNFIFERNNIGVTYQGGDEIKFNFIEKDKAIYIKYDGQKQYQLEFTVINDKTIKFRDIILYHQSIALPLWDIFDIDLLGVTIAYFESKIGPAKRIIGKDYREYEYEGCEFVVFGENSIDALYIENLTDRCTFNIESFFGGDPVNNAKWYNFSAFESYYSHCFYSCGQQFPRLYGFSSGSHATNFIEILGILEFYSNDDDNSLDSKYEMIINKIIQEKGQDYLIYSKLNNDMTYTGLIKETFKFENCKEIAIGYNLKEKYFKVSNFE